jgi:hypothetical protein
MFENIPRFLATSRTRVFPRVVSPAERACTTSPVVLTMSRPTNTEVRSDGTGEPQAADRDQGWLRPLHWNSCGVRTTGSPLVCVARMSAALLSSTGCGPVAEGMRKPRHAHPMRPAPTSAVAALKAAGQHPLHVFGIHPRSRQADAAYAIGHAEAGVCRGHGVANDG